MGLREEFRMSRQTMLNASDIGNTSLSDSTETTPPRLGGLTSFRVLIADPDEGLLAKYVEHSRDGFEVLTAPNGLECVKRLRQNKPDMLVLEPQMQWGCGEGILTMMHEVLDLAGVPVMLLTSCNDSVLSLVTRFPISDYHHKPLEPEQLVKRVHTFLEQRAMTNSFVERQQRLETRLASLIAKETCVRVPSTRMEAVSAGAGV